MQAVERLGFTPNAISKHLRTLRTGKLIVTVPDIANPFFSLILKGIEDAAQREGYNVLVGDTQHDGGTEERYAEMLKRKEADGLIFLGSPLPKRSGVDDEERRATLCARRQRLRIQSRASAFRASTSTTRRRPRKRWHISTAWAIAGLES
jgi:DNA-binding LacI/PurR family transcriptional regulator